MPTEDQLRRARKLVLEYGWNATAYQILNPGIELWFSDRGDAVIGYVRHRRMLVVAGAPVCALDQLPAVGEEFVASARRRGLRICYFGAGDRLESIYADSSSWSRVLLGAQPVWDPRSWPAAVAARPSLRAQFNRARNKGIRIVEWDAAKAGYSPELRRCLREWLATRGLPPLHFLVEPETLSNLRDRRVFVAQTRDDDIRAFTVLSPVPARNGWLVEQIIRGRSAPNGTAELLLDHAMRAVGASGASYATLGLSPLSQRAGVSLPPQPLWLRFVLEWIKLHGARFYNFVGLDSFKAKFNPDQWEPIYAIAEGARFSAAALYGIAGAFSGGGPIRLVVVALVRAAVREMRTLLNRVRSKGRRQL